MVRKVFKKGIQRTFLGKPLAANEYTIDSLSVLQDYLKFKPAQIRQVICKQSQFASLAKSLGKACDLVAVKDQDYEEKSPILARVEVVVGGENALFERIQGPSRRLVLALDHLQDPHNLGAIARTAAFFGVREIMAPKDRQVPLTQSAVDTSQGAFSLCDLYTVTNLTRALEKAKDLGYWIAGADMEGQDIGEVSNIPEKTVLVLGAEGKGLSSLVRKSCDFSYRICGAEQALQSLNVSVASGILIQKLFSCQKS